MKVEGLVELEKALKDTPDGLKDLRTIHRELVAVAAEKVRADVPIYRGQHSRAKPEKIRRGSHTWLGTAYLASKITKSSALNTGWVADEAPYLIVQEFGGSSYWHRGGVHGMREKSHGRVWNLGGGVIGVGKTKHIAKGNKRKGQIIYTKPRREMGYFLWNVAYRKRLALSAVYERGLNAILTKHGLKIEKSKWDGHIDFIGEKPPGRL